HSTAPHCLTFFLSCYAHHPHLHSFPTRRSSDLYLTHSMTLDGLACQFIDTAGVESAAPLDEIQQAAQHAAHQQVQDAHLEVLCIDRKSTRLNSSHVKISYAVFCLKKKTNKRRKN